MPLRAWALAALHFASARPAAALVGGRSGRDVWVGTADADQGHLPRNLDDLRATFGRLLEADRIVKGSQFARPRQRGLAKVLIGIFTTLSPRDVEVREIVRGGWMKHPDVCSYPHRTDDCTVCVMFVAGAEPGREDPGAAAAAALSGSELHFLDSEPDVLIMDIEENMDAGKTFDWLQLASRRFEWADYVGKADEDIFLHVSNVVDALPLKGVCPDAYLGKPWTCVTAGCPPRDCGPPVSNVFSEYAEESWSSCWTYMQGGFYALSRGMAKEITEPNSYFDQIKTGPEDKQTGMAINQYTRRTGKCVHVWGSETVAWDRAYLHLRARNEHPGKVSQAWEDFYEPARGGAESALDPSRVWGDLKDLQSTFDGLLKAERLPDGNFARPSRRKRIALGIFTTLNARGETIQELHRTTWMKHPDVCTIANVNEDCLLMVAFVVQQGHNMPADGKWRFAGNDIIALNTRRRTNTGLSYTWFRIASELPWGNSSYDYVAKAEETVFPHPAEILDALPPEGGCPRAYLGRPWSCRWQREVCPPQKCGPPEGRELFGPYGLPGKPAVCWTYMQGGFYALSRDFAAELTGHGGFFETHRVGPEAQRTGQAVSEYGRATGNCVRIWDNVTAAEGRLFYHHAQEVDLELPNEEWESHYGRSTIADAKKKLFKGKNLAKDNRESPRGKP